MTDPVPKYKPDGVRCPACGGDESNVVDSRGRADSGWWRRRLRCKACGERWTTIEVHEDEVGVKVKVKVTAASIKLVSDVSDAVLVAEINRRFGWTLKEGEAKP